MANLQQLHDWRTSLLESGRGTEEDFRILDGLHHRSPSSVPSRSSTYACERPPSSV